MAPQPSTPTGGSREGREPVGPKPPDEPERPEPDEPDELDPDADPEMIESGQSDLRPPADS
jgi:hypothetical protein